MSDGADGRTGSRTDSRAGAAGEKLMKLTGTQANVSGIMHLLDKTADPAARH